MIRREIATSQIRVLVLAVALVLLLVASVGGQGAGMETCPTETGSGAGANTPMAGPPVPKADAAAWAKIEPQILKELAERGSTTYIVYLREQADLKSFTEQDHGPPTADRHDEARSGGQWSASVGRLQQRQTVVRTLQATAGRSQAGIRAFLDRQLTTGAVQHYIPFWVFNGLAVTGDQATLLALAARPDVEKIRANHVRQLPQPVAGSGGVVSWNLDKIRARDAWRDFGIDGRGVVVANMDSGVQWDHPALQAHYRGTAGAQNTGGFDVNQPYPPPPTPSPTPPSPSQHDYNWFDFTGTYPAAPGDGNGHGTHTMGTIVGGDADNLTGVAPGARWIAVKIFDDQGSTTDAQIHQGFQWILAPTDLRGQNPDPARAPDVVNNSWGSAFPDADPTFMPDVAAWRAAGIVPVFSIGNEGELGAGSVGTPGAYPTVIGVGATNADDLVADFSGRGPSFWDQIKPQVSAPGVSVRSTLPGNDYGTLTGTSMAAPHVTGLSALLLQADPGLTFDDIENFLKWTAVDLGTPGPDNDYGWGRIDAYQAVRWALSAGRLHGRVTTVSSQMSVVSSQISVVSSQISVVSSQMSVVGSQMSVVGSQMSDYWLLATDYWLLTTVSGVRQGTGERFTTTVDADGVYHVAVPAGRYDVTATAFGYQPASLTGVEVITGFLTLNDFALKPAPTGRLAGQVTEAGTGRPLIAEVTVIGTPVKVSTDAQGRFSLSLPPGIYQVSASAPRHRAQTVEAEVSTPGSETGLTFALPTALSILLVDADSWLGVNVTTYFRYALDQLGYPYTVRLVLDTANVPTAAEMSSYDIVLWVNPWSSPGWIEVRQRHDTAVTDALRAYLNGGGRLLIIGQDIGYWDSGEGLAPGFYRQYLHAIYQEDDAGNTLTGVTNDVLAGIHLILDDVYAYKRGDFLAGDGISPADPPATSIITYDASGRSGGLRVATDAYRLIYLSFGLEGAGPRDRFVQTLGEALAWLGRPGFVKTVDQATTAPGATLTYQLRLSNTSSTDLPGATVSDPLPAQVDYVPGSATCSGPQPCAPTYDPASRAIRWSGTLAATSALTFTFQATVARPLIGGTVLTNTATLDDGRGRPLAASAVTTVEGPNLSGSTKQASPAVVGPGDLLTYTITLRGSTRSDAPNTRLTDPIPAGTTYVAGSVIGPGDGLQPPATYNPDTRQIEWTGTVPGAGAPPAAYTWSDSDQPGGPVYNWIDITGIGTPITGLADDTNVGPFDIGFSFPFYDQTFNTFRLCSNGFLSFTSTSTAYNNQLLPSGAEPFNLLAIWWDDLIFNSAGQAFYWTNQADTLVVSFVGVPRLTSGGPYTFQAILKADGTITYQYQSMQDTRLDEATIGIQNGDGTAGITVAHNQAYVHDRLAVRFSPPAAGGRPATISFRVRVNSDVPANTTIANTATVTDSADLTYRLSASSLVQPADLSTSVKTVEPEVAETGQALRYTISLRNTGAADAPRVTVTDTLPADVTFVPGSITGGASYDPATRSVTWTGNVPRNDQQTITFQATVNPGLVAGTRIFNTVTIDDGLRPPYQRLATAVVQAADLSASRKVVDRDVAASGEELSYLITLTNLGFLTASQVSLVDPLPAGTTYVPGSATSGATYNAAANRIEWQGTVPARSGYTAIDSTQPGGPSFNWVDITDIGTRLAGLGDDTNLGPFDVGFDFPFYGQVFRQFYLSSNGFLSFSPIRGDNYINYHLPTPLAPGYLVAMFWDDLTFSSQGQAYTWANGRDTLIVSFVGVPRYESGGPYTFQAILRADGSITLQYLDMRGTRLNEATIGVQNADGSEGLTVAADQDYVRNNLAVLIRPPATAEIGFRVRLGDSLPFETTVVNTAAIDDGRGRVIQCSATTRVNTVDLSGSTFNVDRNTARPGDTLTYRTELRNAGSATANAQVSIPLPGQATYVAGSATGGATYDAAGHRITWTGEVPATFTFAVRLAAPLANATRVETVATVNDGVHPPFTRTATTTVQAPDLAGSTKSVDQSVADVGQTLNYTVLVQNSGDVSAEATVTDTLPANTTYVDGSARATTGHAPVYDPANRWLVWRGTLPPRSRMALMLAVQVTDYGPIVNRAAINDGQGMVVERTAETRPLATPTPVVVEVVIPAARADTGYVTSEDRMGNRFGVREIYTGVDDRPQTPVTLNGAFQFDLSALPADARILDARVELIGLDNRFLDPTAHSRWTLVLLDSSVDRGWTGLGYWHIHNASIEATLSPALTEADLEVGKANVFDFGSGLVALQSRLTTTQRASFRLDGTADRPRLRQVFAWDGAAPPVLRVKYTR